MGVFKATEPLGVAGLEPLTCLVPDGLVGVCTSEKRSVFCTRKGPGVARVLFRP